MSNILKKMKRDKKKKKEYPFVVHYCARPSECMCPDCVAKREEMGIEEMDKDFGGLFSTHTHGLEKIGKPEMFIDPLAFDKWNATIINNVYDHLNKTKNVGMTEKILDGELVKIKISELCSMFTFRPSDCPWDMNLIICLRVVDSSFEAVKGAYGEDIPEEIKFIQIYVDGDNFALSNSYYEGGVTY